jgi:hypothetical protein
MSPLGTVLAPQPQHDDICYIRARRRVAWRPNVIYELLRLRGGRVEVLATTGEVAEGSGEAATVRDQLIRRLFREGWIPTKERLIAGADVLYVRPRRQSA